MKKATEQEQHNISSGGGHSSIGEGGGTNPPDDPKYGYRTDACTPGGLDVQMEQKGDWPVLQITLNIHIHSEKN